MYNPFVTTPNWCGTTITCLSVSPANQGLSCTGHELDSINDTTTWSFDGFDYATTAPGTYTYTYEVCISGLPATCKTFNVILVLTDPCDPPNFIEAPRLDEIVYVITDNAVTYTNPTFTANPAFCPVTYSFEIDRLANGNTPIVL